MENRIKMDDLGVPLFLETPTCLGTPTSKNEKNASRFQAWYPDGWGSSEPTTGGKAVDMSDSSGQFIMTNPPRSPQMVV